MMDLLFLAGRVLFGGVFLYNGLNHIRNYEATRGYTAYKHVPMPAVATIISAVWLLTGGASVVTGFRPEIGLGLIVAFLAVVTPKMHDFWAATDPTQRLGDFINFQKNVALAGAGLMMLAIPRPWPYSL
jgi:putative oxidoreductase